MKVIVFDLGSTLMQYVGMPYSWVEFYKEGIKEVIHKNKYCISEQKIEETIKILECFNPRINYRENEYSAEYIFTKAFEHWNMDIPIQKCMETFWSGLKLETEIFLDTIPVLNRLKEQGYMIATLTDLPSAMPDEFFKKDISELLEYFDYYVSSDVSGYRKPNCRGLQMIAPKYNVPIDELIFVGDEQKDRQTALNAKCKFIQINRFEKSGIAINNLYELLEII